jgi:hypothetical protein
MQPHGTGNQPISIADCRATYVTEDQPMSAERKAAYRQLALVVLGMDIQTLTKELRARRMQRMVRLHVVSRGERAA